MSASPRMEVINVDVYVLRSLPSSLRANNFELNASDQCNDLLAILENFSRYISRQYNEEILRQLAAGTQKSLADLISWTVSELCSLQAIAFSKLEREISRGENISPGNGVRITCIQARNYVHLLTQMYEVSAAEWRAGRAVEPLSRKHIQKRRFHDWVPWGFDFRLPGP